MCDPLKIESQSRFNTEENLYLWSSTTVRTILKDREEDLYRCMHHFNRPDVCPETHSIYHNMLYDYVLAQVKAFSKSLKRRKLGLKLAEYGEIEELTLEILNAVIERIEIGHVTRKSKPGKVISIYWKLN